MASFVKCFVVLLVLCICSEVFECKNYRRHDVHRIVIKPKRKASYKKPIHSHVHDYPHYHIQDDMYDPFHAESTHQFETMDDFQYMPSHHTYSNRYREPERYKDRVRYTGYKPFPSYQQFDFEGYKSGYQPDYKTYRDMMEEYNRKQEEDFRRQVEKAKMQMHYVPKGQDMYQYAESQERPVWNAPEENGMIKGDWSPMHNSDTPHHLVSYANAAFESPSTTLQTPQYIDYTKLDMTTSKPHRVPLVSTAKNSTNTGGRHKINYNFSPNYFPNHKPDNYKDNVNEVKEGVDNEGGNEFQPSAVVSTSYSTLWGNDQNETDNNSNRYQPSSGTFGSKTKVRRTKRPAYASH